MRTILQKMFFFFVALCVFVLGQSDYSLKFRDIDHGNRGNKPDMMKDFNRMKHGQNDSFRSNEMYQPKYSRTKQNLSNFAEGKYVLLTLVGDTIRYSYTYDNNGNRLTYLYEEWLNNAWVNSFRLTYTYDNNGNRLTELDEGWVNNAWVNYRKYTYTYDNDGNRLTELYEDWSNNAWVNSSKSTFTYDINGNWLTDLSEIWENNAWVNSSKYTYTYDNNGNAISGQYYIWSNSSWVSSRGSLSFSYNNGLSNYSIYSSSATATYQYVTDVEQESSEEMNFSLSQNYPNPFNPSTTINFSLSERGFVMLDIFSISGEKIFALLNQELDRGSFAYHFESKNLSSGTYFYRLVTERGSLCKKMLLMK